MIESNAKDLIRQLKGYKKELNKKEETLTTELVRIGGDIANKQLNNPRLYYTGYVDANIEVDVKRKEGYVAMVGYSAGFIEFGTGVYYERPDESHPNASDFGAIRGEWGRKRGKNPPWTFDDEPGTMGWRTKSGTSMTLGFPANRIMYNTGKELREEVKDIIEDVFND